eukprot:COSAG01_NODE_2863_length_6958_cov_7.166351_3_plen_234_part_00
MHKLDIAMVTEWVHSVVLEQLPDVTQSRFRDRTASMVELQTLEQLVHEVTNYYIEERDGIVSKPYPRPPLYPSQTQPGLAVEQPDKLRICIAMNGPLDDDIGGGSMSVNANIDMDDTSKVPRLVLPSAQSFGRGIGVLMAGLNKSTHPVFVFASDWKRFYRQLPKFLKDLFHQITAIGKSGFRIEWFMMFGDGAAPAGANGAEDSFIQMIYYYMNDFVAKAHEHQWPSEEYWT